MELIKTYFKEYSASFTDSLHAAEFSDDEIKKFLAEAESSMAKSSQRDSIFKMMKGLLSAHPYQLSNIIDVDGIAEKSDMTSEQATLALRTITPTLIRAFTVKQ